MVRVLVVDDEKEIRNGMVTRLPWAEWGAEEVLDADDGDTALELAMRCRPDLVITDIRMPRMSGLQLIEALVRGGYDGGLIVISGYDEFGYAKDAFKLGVTDYLLKPVDKDELAKAVAVSLNRLREKNKQEESRSLIRQGYELVIAKMREEILCELIEGAAVREEQCLRMEQKTRQLELDWLLGVRLRLTIFGIDSLKAVTAEGPADKKAALLAVVGSELQLFFGERLHRFILFRSKEEEWIGLFEDGDDELASQLDSMAEEACRTLGNRLGIRLNRGQAAFSGTFAQLHDLYSNAAESLIRLKLALDTNEDEPVGHPEDQLSIPKELAEILRFGSEREIRQAMMGFPKLVKSWDVHHTRDLQQRTFEWLLDVFRSSQKAIGWKDASWEKNPILLWEELERFDTLDSLRQQVTVQLLKAAESLKAQFDSRSQIVHAAQHFIMEHYQENLTLHTVADHVHVTPVWLSKLFKKETGMNFLEYMTDIRMTKAAELLADLNHKVYQISYNVGYQDPVHFSKLFKRKYGLTPQEFRNSRANQHG